MTPAQCQKHLQAALALHQAGRLDEAAAGYEAVLAVLPRNFDAAHLAGTVALQKGQFAEAAKRGKPSPQLEPITTDQYPSPARRPAWSPWTWSSA